MVESKVLIFYSIASLIAAGIELLIAYMSMKKRSHHGNLLAYSAIAAAVVNASYLGSIFTPDYLFSSIMASVYFIAIDWMLVLFYTFVSKRTKYFSAILHKVLAAYAVYETLVFAINPFTEIAISYSPRPTPFACYTYTIKPLYSLHLIATYAMTVMIIFLLLRKIFCVPHQYRRQYIYMILGIMLIVLVNAVFLFVPVDNIATMLDYSVLAYGVMLTIIYWSSFEYTAHQMLQSLSLTIFDNIDQGLILFDFEGCLVMKNEIAQKILSKLNLNADLVSYEDLIRQLKIQNSTEEEFTSMCYIEDDNDEVPLRCDCRSFHDKKREVGKLFTFTDMRNETDLLTGFHNWESFEKHDENQFIFDIPSTVVILDINNLATINATYGRDEGNIQIGKLARLMRKYFSQNSYFLRGRDAHLLVVCSKLSSDQVQASISCIRKEMGQTTFQYAIADTSRDEPSVKDAGYKALHALNTKKLMDADASHSRLLTALVRALKEVDSDTEVHVKRTQKMGERIGARLMLSDLQKSELALLCILHDIGKISVPTDILNKPGKLSEEDLNILRMHPQKGFEIAQSAPELKSIAPLILHHHEHWDGSGYPDGLSCESIPLLSRIIAVVDAYDAMTYNRMYRKAMSQNDAIAQLKKNAGTMFDPHIVAEFIAMLEESNEIQTETKDTMEQAEMPVSEFFPEAEHTELVTSNCVALNYTRYKLNADDVIISVDENFQKITGYTKEEAESGQFTQSMLIFEEDRAGYFVEVGAQIAKTSSALIEHRIRRKDGSKAYVFCYGRKYYDSSLKGICIEIIATDVGETAVVKNFVREEKNKSINRLRQWENTYRVDGLTGLMNRPAYQSALDEHLLHHHEKICFMMIDLDHFKQYNDTFGHQAGDECLIRFAQTLEKVFGEKGYVCRMGGDEFSVSMIFDQECSTEEIKNRIEESYGIMSRMMQDSDKIATSMGAAISNTEMNTFSELYVRADNALYESKENGRARLIFAKS